MKKIIALILAAAMVMSLAAVSAFADEDKQQRERPLAQRGEGFGGRGANDGRGRNDGRLAGLGRDTEAIEQAIAGLDDEAKAQISALLEKYAAAADAVEAARGEKRSELDELQQAAAAAWNELNEALKTAGAAMPEMPEESRPDAPAGGLGGMRFGRLPDDDVIEEAIAALEDETVKNELYLLLEKWDEACDDYEDAFEEDSRLTDEQKQTLAQAARDAHRELVEALKEAGIELNSERPERQDRPQKPESEKSGSEKPAKSDEGAKAKDNAASSEAAAATQPTEPKKGGFFDKFTGWLTGLLG